MQNSVLEPWLTNRPNISQLHFCTLGPIPLKPGTTHLQQHSPRWLNSIFSRSSVMDYTFSQHRDGGGTLHLPSPTQAHNYHDSFSSISKIRRSLSRSPSKLRFPIQGGKSPNGSPNSPLSPLALSRAFTPSPTSPKQPTNILAPVSPLAEQAPVSVKKNKFILRRTSALRSSPRINAQPRSPIRRALSETSNQANVTPSASRRASQEEDESRSVLPQSQAKTPGSRFGLDDGPIKFEFARPRPEFLAPTTETNFPVKSSPLKRSDGVLNFDSGSFGSPVAKRRSVHSAVFSSEFDIFQMNLDGANERDVAANPFASPMAKKSTDSPLRKSISLRKSTLHQRQSATFARQKHHVEDSGDTSSASPFAKSQNRLSLDGSLFNRETAPSPFFRSSPLTASAQPSSTQRPTLHRSSVAFHQPHPLSHAAVASSSSSSFTDDMKQQTSQNPSSDGAQELGHRFARSLPIGSARPVDAGASQESEASSFATPDAYKMAKPLPAAFMSTGLISKRNRNANFSGNEQFAAYAMPDTPSKRVSFPPMTATPGPKSVLPRPHPEFGSPSTPFSANSQKPTPTNFSRSANLFAAPLRTHSLTRQTSVASFEGDEASQSPSGHHDSQSSADELPPTPTKHAGSSLKQKENSLRSSLFGRRISIQADTFMPPASCDISAPKPVRKGEFLLLSLPEEDEEDETAISKSSTLNAPLTPASSPLANVGLRQPTSSEVVPRYEFRLRPSRPISYVYGRSLHRPVTPTNSQDNSGRTSPHTPSESLTPPDACLLSIPAAKPNAASTSFGSSTSFNQSFPPATPTAPRDHVFPYGPVGLPVAGVPHNDVDTSLTSRFGWVSIQGLGEFSQVYRVQKPLQSILSHRSPRSPGAATVWAVKKSKKPYAGNKDRERKLREVEILRMLRGNDHIINFVDFWESKGHLYIQTEFCEDGNLKDFLTQTGFNGRLDDFRIWKILLELSLGVKHIHDNGFIHLDLKPANVFIDFEGVLKIGDFGLATPWPAAPYVEGEGDREYLAPEVLSGRLDKPADIFALGMIMLEIAGNIILPDNGTSWQRLRAGDMSDLPSLTWSSESSLPRDESGDPIPSGLSAHLNDDFLGSDQPNDLGLLRRTTMHVPRSQELVDPPKFMVDPEDEEALDKVVAWMISANPDDRPAIGQVYQFQGVRWVEARRRSGATIYEGNWGPSDDVLNHSQDVDMTDV